MGIILLLEECILMKCLNCGHEINLNDKFCPNCGGEIKEIVCPNCSSKIPHDSIYCPRCHENIQEILNKNTVNAEDELKKADKQKTKNIVYFFCRSCSRFNYFNCYIYFL